MAEIGFFIVILLGFPGPSDGLRLHPTVFFSSGSGLTADSSVLTLTLAFLDFGLDFAQSFPVHAQYKCNTNKVFHSASKAEDVFRVLLVLKLVLQLGSSVSHATTRYKGKEIAKPITPPYELASEEDSDPEQAQRDKDMQKNLALIAKYFKKIYKPTNNNLKTSTNTRNKNVDTTLRYKNDNQTGQFGNLRAINVAGARETVGGQVVQQFGIQCFNCKEFGHNAKECRKLKRAKDSMYHKEKMLLCKQAEKVETGDSNVIPDSPDMCDNDIQDDQNDVECDDERVALANLKLNFDENKKIQKQLKKANATLTQELTECKSILAETSRTLGESNSTRDSCLVALQNK
ncbi:retrovirus-related pol polyprotein from transposon TNT 1-94 [Tanacetum coccineum]